MTPLAADTEIVEEVRFASGRLTLEGRLCYPETAELCGVVVLAGPHPLLGGDLDNNVVRGLSAGLARRGVAVLAFNYRGVGASEGASPDVTADLAEFWTASRTGDEAGYADDFRAAVRMLPVLVGDLPTALVGYSFGCSVLPAARPDPRWPLALVAPTLGRHDYMTLAVLPNPVLVVAPTGDFAADAGAVATWFAALHGPKCLVRGEWDDHFFRGLEDRLAETVFAFLRERWEHLA
ncbi:MAG: alpha/beta fold hydrolase [Planctomycetes bacterium]|nr:alpha/beta fold hydrolase [Planctomycetota bacterium]